MPATQVMPCTQPPAVFHAVLFDLDGTLLDSAPGLAAAANAMRATRGLPALPLSALRPFVGSGARGMVRMALGVQPEEPAFADLREEFFRAYEGCMMAHDQLFDGVPALLRALDVAGLPWGIVTNKLHRFADPIVHAHPVLCRTGVLVCSDTTAHAKPHPAPLLEAARCLGVSAPHCVYVGDDLRDMQAAHAAQMMAAAAAWGYLGETAPDTWGANVIVDTAQALQGWLGL